jgi:hypothetical protein
MNTEKLESKIQLLVANLAEETFIYDLLLAYEQPPASITRLKKGDYNLSKTPGEILWKNRLFYRKETDSDLHDLIDNLKSDPAIIKQHPRFIVVTDFITLLSVDAKTGDTLDAPILDLAKHFDFFLPWAGMEKSQFQSENPADIKAAVRMGQLYDIILKDNPAENKSDRHALNIFLSRLLFCFFAEDTGIFTDDQFTNAVASHTAKDGSNLQAYLQKLFKVLNLSERSKYPQFLQDFPYVNGGLFADESPVPMFSAKSRKIIIECGTLNWKAINPDIFGSMMQAVVHNDQRGSMGIHYTSVINIMKVIEPLFLDDLYAELELAGNSNKKLTMLLGRLYRIRIFDPACGSGNFLVIAYKELCKLEIEVFKRLKQKQLSQSLKYIKLTHFFGIELDDFAHETAKLSLWLAEHQMNLSFKEAFGITRPTLPLQDGGHIICDNAMQLDWDEVCPKNEGFDIYIIGNPPYLGARMQSKQQKADIAMVFDGIEGHKNLDYISGWLMKGAEFIKNTKLQLAFVTTNSICQGEQVAILWPHIFSKGLEIIFAHQSFKWTNNAKSNAGVTCVVVGVSSKSTTGKKLFHEGICKSVENINAYLIEGSNSTIVRKRAKPLSNLSLMTKGNMPYDGGNFSLTTSDKDSLIDKFPESRQFVKRLLGAREFIHGLERWCIWIPDNKEQVALSIPPIKERVEAVKKMRLSSTDLAANKLADRPYQFREINEPTDRSIIVPSVTSERRDYVPMDFLDDSCIVTNLAFVIYNADCYLLSVLSSRIHMTWVRTVAGRLKTDYRYSSAICYNTFPFPVISEAQKKMLEDHVFRVIHERELHPEKTMAALYDPDKMPDGLRKAHHEMDFAVEQCYRLRPFRSDEERMKYLFKLYEEMIETKERNGDN